MGPPYPCHKVRMGSVISGVFGEKYLSRVSSSKKPTSKLREMKKIVGEAARKSLIGSTKS